MNPKPYMFLNLKKHTLIIKKKNRCKTGVIFPEENLCQGKILGTYSHSFVCGNKSC